MSVSAIISNMNGARFLPRLIETLHAQDGVELEIIVIDRESKDESLEILARFPNIKVFSEPAASGLATGYHRGVREATKGNLFFANEDLWLDKDCLAALESHISMENRVAAADPWQWTYDGKRWDHGGTRFTTVWWAVSGLYPFRRNAFTVDLPEGAVVPMPCAGAFLIRKSVYEELGGLDTTIFIDHEDIDLFIRAWQRGWKCVTVPRAKVYHAVGMSTAQTGVSKRRFISNRVGKTIIPLKYFSTFGQLYGWANYLTGILDNLRTFRFGMLKWDIEILREIMKRLPGIKAARQSNREWNRRFPGEKFFTAADFQMIPRRHGDAAQDE